MGTLRIVIAPINLSGGERSQPAPGPEKAAGQDRSCGWAGGGCNHPLPVMCARAAITPILSGFTIGHIGGIMGRDCLSSEDHFCRDARSWRERHARLLPDYHCSHLIAISADQ